MPAQARKIAERLRRRMAASRGGFVRSFGPNSTFILWAIAVLIGIATGYVVILFRLSISALQTLLYGADDEMIHSVAANLPWHLVLFIPVAGGLIVGILLNRFTPDGRARGVADVIRAAALSEGRVNRRQGLASAAAALVTLSTGGSTGREGPAVHLGAVLASWVSAKLGASGMTGRDILGCAAAAAVSASFNAPLAGALFALEVVLRHFALHAFGPIVIASVAGAVVSRIHLGDITEYHLPSTSIGFYQEIPAFMMLGVVSGVVAVAMMRAIFLAEEIGDRAQRAARIPNWLRPSIAGFLLGLIALGFPHIIGVGYETTARALTSQLPLLMAVVFATVKVAAVAVTFAGRMGGGVFSPALMLGALTGSAFGDIAISVFPAVAGAHGLYALAGLGAVSGAVLGAPISTTLIVFELTGDWQAGIAVMISVSLASVIADRLVARSFFLTQIERQGLHFAVGPQGYLAATLKVRDLMRLRGAEDGASDTACHDLIEQSVFLSRDDTLERALPLFDRLRGNFIPVVDGVSASGEPGEVLGALFRIDALRAYNRVLEEELREEHA